MCNFPCSCSLSERLLDAINGNSAIPLGQQCGGYIDSVSLRTLSYLDLNGNTTGGSPKGFICPLGQTCQEESTNPLGNLQSYDNIFMAALQVVVIASANTVRGPSHLNRYALLIAYFCSGLRRCML